MNGLDTANNSPREGPTQSADAQQPQLRQHGSDVIANNCHDVAAGNSNNNTSMNHQNNTSLAAGTNAAVARSSTTNNSAAGDTMIKERPRFIPQSVDSSNAADDNTDNNVARVGAHHVNESAPNINRRFFNGMSNRNARMRAREERRLQREGNNRSNANATANQQNNNDGDVNNNGDMRSVIDEDFNSTSQSMLSRNNDNMQSRRTRFTRWASNSNLLHDNTNDNNQSRRNLFSRMTSQSNLLPNNNNHDNDHRQRNELAQSIISQTHSITATLVDDENVVVAEAFALDEYDDTANNNNAPLPDSEVGRIISRLEYRNTHRVPVSSDVKWRFLRLCDEACVRRVESMREIMNLDNDEDDEENSGSVGSSSGSSSNVSDSSNSNNSSSSSQDTNELKPTNQKSTKTTTTSSPCILREDIIQLRNTVRLAYESRTKFQQFQKSARSIFGFRDVDKVLLNVLNRAVDSIDASGHVEAKKRRALTRMASTLGRSDSLRKQSGVMRTSPSNENLENNPSGMLLRTNSSRLEGGGGGGGILDDSYRSFGSQQQEDDVNDNKKSAGNTKDDEKLEWFYYKDFAFYNLKVESKYPWVRNAGLFSLLVTVTFLLFTPVLWCVVLRDENICPSHQSSYNGWLSSLYFASVTMSTVGYGDVTVLVNYDGDLDSTAPYPQKWRIFIATIYMILSLIVSVVGFQAGLDSHFSPFRRRVDLTLTRVYEILRDANIMKGSHDKHEDIVSRMRFAKFSQLAEISLIFLILNLVGVFAVQLSLVGDNSNEFESLTWMESLYWAVQTTTTIGYGDVDIPPSLRWFMIFYLAISTYFVGSAFGKLRDLSQKLESMQNLYLWQQQEATYTMLADFSGRPENEDGKGNEIDGLLEVEPEIDQFEFTIASLVLLGKITSEDVRPILEKFAKLSGKSNKITAADVSGPIKKKNEAVEETDDSEEIDEKREDDLTALRRSSSGGALSVTKKIAQAFKEEMFSSTVDQEKDNAEKEEERDSFAADYSRFRIPTNTHAIAIDDSKIQRKLLSKLIEFAGIPEERATVVGDGHDEIMGFEDFVVNFMENHPEDFVFLLVDENLDVVNEDSVRSTISGSLCVEKIRQRLPAKLERRMFALVRSANDSSSDIAIYSTRAHGFLPKAPIKRDKVLETLAPLWHGRFPPSEFGETIGFTSKDDVLTAAVAVDNDIACTPYDIAQQIEYIGTLFRDGKHISEIRLIHEQMHGLKGDLLTLNSTISVTSIIGHINLILVAQSPETTLERWNSVRDEMTDILNTIQKNFRFPKNMHAIAIDDSKIQRKLLSKFFDFMGLGAEQCTVLGDGADEIKGFEDFVVKFMNDHKSDYVFMVVDENLDVVDQSSGTDESISGSVCVENIRKRLPYELERRLFALVRSANDSTSDIAIYNDRAHGFLPKAPIRREKVTETLAPLWLKRFPPAQFGDSVAYENSDESESTISEELACSAQDIAHKLVEMDARFNTDRTESWRWMHDQLHELKGDILTMTSDASMISVLGMINLLLGYKDSILITEKWPKLRDRIYSVINEEKTASGTVQPAGSRWTKVRISLKGTSGSARQKRRSSALSHSNSSIITTEEHAALFNSIKSTTTTSSPERRASDISNSIKSVTTDFSDLSNP